MTPIIFGLLVEAALYTVVISGVSIVIGFLIGMCVSAARLSSNRAFAIPLVCSSAFSAVCRCWCSCC